jgi:membrane fusion protein (multidrug efflux system)
MPSNSTIEEAPAAEAQARADHPVGGAPIAVEPKKRKPPILPIAGVIALLAVLYFGYQWWQGRGWESTDDAQVEGHITPVSPKAAGFVSTIAVSENQIVHAGDLLVQLDTTDYHEKLKQADADLAALAAQVGSDGQGGQIQAQAAAARAEAGAAQSSIAQAQANAVKAHRDLDRFRPLAERNIISRQQLDAAVAAAAAADAQVAAARQTAAAAGSQASAATAGLRSTQARAAGAQAMREQAALQLSYTHIRAPVDGIVTKKGVEVGQLVAVGQPLMTIVPLSDVWVTANLKETQVRDVRPGEKVELEVDAYPGLKFEGHVESISPATGAKFSLLPPDNATGNYTKVVQRIPVRVRVDRADAAHPLRPGMSAVVRIHARP